MPRRVPAGYSPDWPEISFRLRYGRARGRCEWEGCGAIEGQPHPLTGSVVVLQVMHLDHDTTNNDDANLKAACQRCHNLYDQPMRLEHAAVTRQRTANKRRGLLPFAQRLPDRLLRR